MPYRRGRWALQRERFQIPEGAPAAPICEARLADVIPEVMRGFGLGDRMWLVTLEAEWPSLVGEPVARHTRPGRFRDGTLHVFVDSAVWLSELVRYGRDRMLANLQARYGAGKIRDLRIEPAPER